MKNKTFLSFVAFLLFVSVSVIGSFLLYPNNVSAQGVTPETRCYNKKLIAAGAYVRCLLRAEVNANRNGEEVSEGSVEHCHQRFETRFENAEAQAAGKGAVCPSHGGLVPFQDTVLQAYEVISSSNNVNSLTINIAGEDYNNLRAANYNLNIAIKVNGTFNVVWYSINDFSTSNKFQFSPIFHLFATRSFQSGAFAKSETNVVNVSPGHMVVLDSVGVIRAQTAGDSPEGIRFINNFGSDHPALSQQLTDPSGRQAILPIYVSPTTSSQLLTPAPEVLVWFEQNLETSVMFSGPRQFSVTVDFTDVSTATHLFSNEVWTTP